MNTDAAGGVGRGIEPPARRLPESTRPGAVRLQVAELERSLAFYTGVLGFRVLERDGSIARLGAHGDAEVLIELRERAGAAPVPPRGRLGLFHFAILLPDRAALGRFLLHLGELGVRAGASDHLVSEALYLQDPDGLGIEVYADRPRAEWGYDGAQLRMDTRPLDAAGVARAAGGVIWSGMPAGTRIGHLHLHVGELPRAAAFYQAALGLDPTVWSYPGALFLSAGGYHHHLGLNTWAGPAARAAAEDEARLLDWTLLLPSKEDLAAAAASLRVAGFAADAEGDQVVTADPWGTRLRLAVAG